MKEIIQYNPVDGDESLFNLQADVNHHEHVNLSEVNCKRLLSLFCLKPTKREYSMEDVTFEIANIADILKAYINKQRHENLFVGAYKIK